MLCRLLGGHAQRPTCLLDERVGPGQERPMDVVHHFMLQSSLDLINLFSKWRDEQDFNKLLLDSQHALSIGSKG